LDFLWQTGRIKLDADLPTLQAWQNVVSAGIQLPIFTAGRIQANIQASDERLQQALLQYDRTLLQALAEVENHYQQQFSLTQQARLLTQASHTQQQQVRDTQKLFQYGDYTFDRVLQARLDALTLEEKQARKSTGLCHEFSLVIQSHRRWLAIAIMPSIFLIRKKA
ncbi:IbeB, partial [Pasteurella multocida subsp. multocida str. Anand1_buffalo]